MASPRPGLLFDAVCIDVHGKKVQFKAVTEKDLPEYFEEGVEYKIRATPRLSSDSDSVGTDSES